METIIRSEYKNIPSNQRPKLTVYTKTSAKDGIIITGLADKIGVGCLLDLSSYGVGGAENLCQVIDVMERRASGGGYYGEEAKKDLYYKALVRVKHIDELRDSRAHLSDGRVVDIIGARVADKRRGIFAKDEGGKEVEISLRNINGFI